MFVPSRTPRAWVAVPGLLAAVMLLATSAAADAHPALVRSDPPDSTVVGSSPPTVALWFSEPVSPRFSTVQVLDMYGQPLSTVSAEVEPAQPRLLRVDLTSVLPTGAYTVAWRTLSESDGHVTRGHIVLGVGSAATPRSAPESDQLLTWLEAALRGLNLASIVTLIGGLAAAGLILEPAARAARATSSHSPSPASPASAMATPANTSSPDEGGSSLGAAVQRARRWAVLCAFAALGTSLLLLGEQVLTLAGSGGSDGATPWWTFVRLLSGERWGAAWLGRLLLTVGLAIAVTGKPWRGQPRWALLALLAVSLAGIQAASGHAAALDTDIGIAVLADTLHLLAASVWIGGAAALAIGILPELRRVRSGRGQLVRLVWRPFGAIATVCVIVLAVTGVYSVTRQVSTPEALLATAYGQVLIGKGGLVLAAGLLGLLAAFLLRRRPRVELRAVSRLVRIEVALGLAAVLAAGALAALPTARDLRRDPVPALTTHSQQVADLLVSMELKPGQPGPNILNVRVLSMRRPALSSVGEVVVRLTPPQGAAPSDVQAEIADAGVFRAGIDLSSAGAWAADVIVHRAEMPDATASFAWTIGFAAPAASGVRP